MSHRDIRTVHRARPTKLARALALGAVAISLASLSLPACSLLNQEGPDVTCADLLCGKINACREGIIAQCSDGVNVKYHVCGSSDVCKEHWQVQGAFKCTSDASDCEGCRPERSGCEDVTGATTSSATSSTTGGFTASGSSGAAGGGGG